MMTQQLTLASEGVFPATKDANGKLLKNQPKTGLNISGTIQGEGYLAGVPSLFIRLSGCNLRCMWQMEDGSHCRCDTTYASFHPEETVQLSVDAVAQWVKHNLNNIKHVVITGGEPLLQKKPLTALCKILKEDLKVHITIESNGTLFDEDLAQCVDLFSISPKLSNSTPNPDKLAHYQLKETGIFTMHGKNRRNLSALQSYIDLCNVTNKQLQLKFVVGKVSDQVEISGEYLRQLKNYKATDIWLMPLGATREELSKTSLMVLEMSIANGWRYTPRIHIDIFGASSGV